MFLIKRLIKMTYVIKLTRLAKKDCYVSLLFKQKSCHFFNLFKDEIYFEFNHTLLK